MTFTFARFFAVLCSCLLVSCGLPTSGPSGDSILRDADETGQSDKLKVPYCLIKASSDNVAIAGRYKYRLAGSFSDRRPPQQVEIGIGDIVGVTIYEAEVGGLFFDKNMSNQQGNFVTLPNQTVDEKGNIFVPYAGSIKAAGQTRSAIQDSIVAKLRDQALKPQAIVTIIEQRDARISVIGTVKNPQRVPLSGSGERLLDVIANSGGIAASGHETWILLERQGNVAATPFEALINEPANNVYVRSRDTVYVFQEPQTFVAFGATSRQGHVPFTNWRMTLAEGLSEVGGLSDTQAEPASVFVYRMERIKAIEEMGEKCGNIEKKQHANLQRTPVIYQFDLREPSSFFLLQRMQMRNKDVIYVANARSVEITKFLNFLRGINSTIQDPINTAISAYTLKSAASSGGGSAAVVLGGSSSP
jgi:polysaccharide export outer membrane protein